MSLLFAPAYLGREAKKGQFYGFSLLVLAGTLGVFFAGDLLTLLLFFETMSLASYVWVAYEQNEGALRAGDTYMAVAVIGGLSLLMGIVLLYSVTGTLSFVGLRAAVLSADAGSGRRLFLASLFMFFGFGAKAGVFPIHVWLPKAHPVAPAPLSALLSGVLTKTGVFGILIIGRDLMAGDREFGTFILVSGLITMVVGAVTAIFSVNIKKILACSSVSQIGFMATGIGAVTLLSEEIAVQGTVIHMINHTLVKLVVFLVAGVAYENMHVLDINNLKGFGRGKVSLMIPYTVAALSLAGIPGFTGYFSKSIIHEALVECSEVINPGAVTVFEWVFLVSGGATLCYMAKIFKVLFIDKPSREMPKKGYLNPLQAVSVITPAILIMGLSAWLSFVKLPHLFEFEVLKGGLISITIGILLFAVTSLTMNGDGFYRNLWPKKLDLEESVYRPLLLKVLPLTVGFFARIMDLAVDRLVYALRKTLLKDAPLPADRVEGNVITHLLGRGMDVMKALIRGDKTVRNTSERRMSFRYMAYEESSRAVGRSLSYGLLLACIGMFIILGFILYMVYG